MEFDNLEMFEDVGDKFKKDYVEDNENKNSYKKDYKKNDNFKKKKQNIWNEKPEPKPLKDVNINKVYTIVTGNQMSELDDEAKKRIHNVMFLLNKKEFRVRLMCNVHKYILEKATELYEDKKIKVVKPWEKFCVVKGISTIQPSKANLDVAAYYTKNFNNLPNAVKVIKAAEICTLFGPYNNDGVMYSIVYDPKLKKGNKIDYKESNSSVAFYYTPKNIKDVSIGVYNIANDEDYFNLIKLIK